MKTLERLIHYCKHYGWYIALGVLVIFHIALRVQAFPNNIPFEQIDLQRDYLIGQHILEHQEFPATGPQNSFSAFRNSPFYFYLYAFILFIYNDFFFPQIVNSAFQVVSIVLIFLLYRQFTTKAIAFAGSFLFSINSFFMSHSDFMWQPFIMEPVLFTAFLLYSRFYFSKKLSYLSISSIFFAVAALLHLSVVPLIVFFTVLTFFLLPQSNRKKTWVIFTGIWSSIIFVLFIPVIIEQLSKPELYVTDIPYIYETTASAQSFLSKLSLNFIHFFRNTFLEFYFILPTMLLIPFSLYSFFVKDKQKKTILVIASLFVFQLVVLSTFTRVAFSHYFIPVVPAYFFILVYTWAHVFLKLGYGVIFFWIIIAILAYVFSLNLRTLQPRVANLTYSEVEAGANAIVKEVTSIMKVENRTDPTFFEVFPLLLDEHVIFWNRQPMFIPMLEEKLNTKLVTVINHTGNLQMDTGDDYVFIFCGEYKDSDKCRQRAQPEFPQHKYLKQVYTSKDYVLLLFQKQDEVKN